MLFQSRTLIVVIRVGIIFALGFIIGSLIARIWNGQWLSKAGPFEISEDVVDLSDELDAALEEVEANESEIDSLLQRLQLSEQTMEEEKAAARAAGDQLAEMRQRAAVAEGLNEELTKLISRLAAADG